MRLTLPLIALATASFLMLEGCRSKIDKADAYEALFDQLSTAKAYPAALNAIRRSIGYDDTSVRRYLKMAELQLAMGQPAGAVISFQSALDLQPDNIEALQNLAILTARSGQYDAAQRYIDPLLALSPDDPAGLLASGAIALGQRHFAEADKFADRIITALPDRSDGYVLKARALDNLGRTGEAIALLRQRAAVAEAPRDLLVQLMSFYRQLGDRSGIRTTAIRLMPLFPDDPRYALESARAFQDDGSLDRVQAIIGDLTHRFAGNPDVMVGVARFWRETRPRKQATAAILGLARTTPLPVHMILANELIDMGETGAALALLAQDADDAVTGANVDVRAYYARALFAAGRFAEAQRATDAVLAFDEENAIALLIRARLKLRARDYQGAVTDAQRVGSDDQRNAEAALLTATIYAAQGNQILAAGAFGDARQHFPDDEAIAKAEVAWLLTQQRNEEAAQRAATFFHMHVRSGPAKLLYASVCRRVQTQTCRLDPAAPTLKRS